MQSQLLAENHPLWMGLLLAAGAGRGREPGLGDFSPRRLRTAWAPGAGRCWLDRRVSPLGKSWSWVHRAGPEKRLPHGP